MHITCNHCQHEFDYELPYSNLEKHDVECPSCQRDISRLNLETDSIFKKRTSSQHLIETTKSIQANSFCAKHPSERALYICNEDDVMLCGDCVAEDESHLGHKKTKIDKILKGVRDSSIKLKERIAKL